MPASKIQITQTFIWRGTNMQGQIVTGEIQSTNPAMVKAILRRQGITPLAIHKSRSLFQRTRQPKISPKDIAVFTRQLATLLKTGIPMVQSFEIIANGNENLAMRNLVLTLKQAVAEGATLFTALSQYPAHFNTLFCQLVQAGEQGGVLENILDKIAIYQEKTESLKAKIQKAMYYPLAVVSVAIIITGLIMVFVVPQFQSLFSSFGADLPVFTQMILGLSAFLMAYGWLICLIGIISSLAIITTWRRTSMLRDKVDKALYALPIIGKIRHKAALARFCRTTATLFAAGVPLVEVLTAVSGATGSTAYQQAVITLRDQVATGQSLHHVLQQQALFPPMVVQMTAIGEESGTLDGMLAKAADFYEEEVDNAVNGLSSLLEPMIMIILGLLIGGLVIALYLPIFQLGSVVSGR
jgi:type IV pilus assembly protein PilC